MLRDRVDQLAYAASGGLLATARGPSIDLWRLSDEGLERQATLDGPAAGVACLVILPGTALLAAGGWDGTLRLWRLVL